MATHFYSLIKLGASASGAIQRDKLIQKFEHDGVLDEIKEKTVALVVDGM